MQSGTRAHGVMVGKGNENVQARGTEPKVNLACPGVRSTAPHPLFRSWTMCRRSVGTQRGGSLQRSVQHEHAVLRCVALHNHVAFDNVQQGDALISASPSQTVRRSLR